MVATVYEENIIKGLSTKMAEEAPSPKLPNHNETSVPIASGSDLSIDHIEHISKKESIHSFLTRTKGLIKSVYKVSRSLIGLIIILIAYSFLGAFIFQAIESGNMIRIDTDLSPLRKVMVEKLEVTSLNAVHQLYSTEYWRERTDEMLQSYELEIQRALKLSRNNYTKEVEPWDFWSSLFFVGTIYTTIGYGSIYPVTDLGRLVTMIYASIGIPLALLVLAEVGKRFTVALKFLWAYVRRYYYTGYCRKIRKPFQQRYQLSDNGHDKAHKGSKIEIKQSDVESIESGGTLDDKNKSSESLDRHSNSTEHLDEKTKSNETLDIKSNSTEELESKSRAGSKVIYGIEIDEQFNLPMTVAIVILLIYIVLGGLMYSMWESWGFIEAVYFVFISLSTIGFGDVLPVHTKVFILSSVYLFIGLSLVSMCINVAIEFFTQTVDRASQKMDQAKKKIGDTVDKAGKMGREKVAELKTNIKDETHRMGEAKKKMIHKASKNAREKVGTIRSNIRHETIRFKQRTDEKLRKLGGRSRSNTPARSPSIERPSVHTRTDV